MRPVDMPRLHRLEKKAREIGRLIGAGVDQLGTGEHGFCLMLFSFNGPEMTYISNANRADMIDAIEEFLGHLKADTDDQLSRPKGSG